MIKIPANFLRLYAIVVGVDSRFIDEDKLAIYAARGFADYNDILNFIVVSDDQKINNIMENIDRPNDENELNKLTEAVALKGKLPPISVEVANKLNELLSRIFDFGIKGEDLEKIFNSIATILITAMQLKLKDDLSRDDAQTEFTIMRAGFYIILDALVQMSSNNINNFAREMKEKRMISPTIFDDLIEKYSAPNVSIGYKLSNYGFVEHNVLTKTGKCIALAKSVGDHGKIPVEDLVISWFEVNYKPRTRTP